MSAEGRLIVVSNRLPFTLRRAGETWRTDRSSGGLASALDPVLKRTGGLWLGWPGESPPAPDPARDETLRGWTSKHGYVPVELPADVARNFYEGYANQTLWPLFHNFPTNIEFDPAGWEAYVEASRRFRDAVLEVLLPGDLVWVHDYHLMLLPGLLREARPFAAVGFFLHIPFPASEVFRILPRREELLRGLLGADLLAFQTHADLQHFRASLLRICGIESRMDRVRGAGHSTRLEALPIGIAPDEFLRFIEKDRGTQQAYEEHRRRFAGLKILLAVDRLDYTKGIPHRLRTFQRLLRRAPRLRGKLVMVQVAVPSRERIPLYEELRHEVSELVGEINGEFGNPQWTPVVYMRRGISRPELVALYAAADVGWVTPLRDGMNLVAKEYVACQRRAEGVLLLSEFAGAAAEMGEAFLVNPYDEEGTAEVLEKILDLPAEDRRERMAALHRRVHRNTVFAWSERFVATLRDAAGEKARRVGEQPAPLPVPELADAFRRARHRVLFLDYDGTLVPFANTPREAHPSPALMSLMSRLGRLPGTATTLISGRPRADLEAWFGSTAGLWLVAEHGAIMRRPSAAEWELTRPRIPVEWKARVRPVLEHFVDRTPGSFIEEKDYALVFHYRMADPVFGEWLANELVSNLEELLAETELRAIRGQKSVEVRLVWANKGEMIARVESAYPAVDFRFAAGDDRTDEDLFERLPPDAWTVHVGEGISHARFCLSGPAEVLAVLEELARNAPRPSREQGTEHERART
jgi:trehalose 6-phosphate synthase/phosphatase